MKKILSLLTIIWGIAACTSDQAKDTVEEPTSNSFEAENLIGDWIYVGKQVLENSPDLNAVLNKTNLGNELSVDLRITSDTIYTLDYPVSLEKRFSYTLNGNALSINDLSETQPYAEITVKNDSLIFRYNQENQLLQEEYFTKSTFSNEILDVLKDQSIITDSLVGIWNIDTSSAIALAENHGMYPKSFELTKDEIIIKMNEKMPVSVKIGDYEYNVRFIRRTEGQEISLYQNDSKVELVVPVHYNKLNSK